MGYLLKNSYDTVQVYGANFVQDVIYCTIQTTPHGAFVSRVVPTAEFQQDQGQGLLSSLADSVENILGEGIAVAAAGVQTVGPDGFLADSVRFTVAYTPPGGSPGDVTADVDIPVTTLTADESLLG